VAALASYRYLRTGSTAWPRVLRVAAGVAVGLNVVFLATQLRDDSLTSMLRYNFEATLLLATLIGAVGFGIHLSPRMRGLDGFLFIMAFLAELAALTVMHQPGAEITERAWFVSHPLAFAVSTTAFVAGGVAGIAYLLVNWMLRRKPASKLMGNVASLESLERFGRWMPLVGFPFFSFGILTGFCGIAHREDLKQTAWYLDLAFLASLVVWLVYAYLSYGSMYRPQLRGRKAAVLSTYGLGLIVVVFLFYGFSSRVHQ